MTAAQQEWAQARIGTTVTGGVATVITVERFEETKRGRGVYLIGTDQYGKKNRTYRAYPESIR